MRIIGFIEKDPPRLFLFDPKLNIWRSGAREKTNWLDNSHFILSLARKLHIFILFVEHPLLTTLAMSPQQQQIKFKIIDYFKFLSTQPKKKMRGN